MNGMMEQAAKNMPHAMGTHPVAQGAMLAATSYVAGRSLLGSVLLRHPLVMLAAGVVAGYYIHKHQEEILQTLSKAGDLGKDFVLQQKENLADLVEETREKQQAETSNPEQPSA